MTDILLIIAAAFFVSYGWGMRGSMIGGEQGALLPGALLGLALAKFGGIPLFADNYIFFAAAGAAAMSFGGTEPYAQTMKFVLNRRENAAYMRVYKKAYFGIFLKGALWFGIAGCGIGMMYASAGGKYNFTALTAMLALVPALQLIGVKIFNSPYSPAKKKFPKLYFSDGSREEWGGNLLLFAELLIFAVCFKDFVTVTLGAAGFIAGGFGFAFALFLYDITAHKNKKGKYFFGKAQTKGYIDNWKLMEFVLGAVGGGGIAAAYCICKGKILEYSASAAERGFFTQDQSILKRSALILLLCGAAVSAAAIIIDAKKIRFKMNVSELIFRPFISSFLMIPIFAGGRLAAGISAAGTIIFVVWLHNSFDAFNKSYVKIPLRVLITLANIAVFARIIKTGELPLPALLIVYTFVYIIIQLVRCFAEDCEKFSAKTLRERFSSNTGELIVQSVFSLQSAIIIAACLI